MKVRGNKSGQGRKPQSLAQPRACSHVGGKVRVGPYTILAGGTMYCRPEDIDGVNVFVPLLHNWVPKWEFGKRYNVLAVPMQDYGGVPEYWRELIEFVIENELKAGKKVLGFCMGSHGRTGAFIASLVALLESADETPDPIAAARERHCRHAVETLAQAEAIFALRNQPLPEKYRLEFARRAAQVITQQLPVGKKG